MKKRDLLLSVGAFSTLALAALRVGADTISENLTLDADLDLREQGAVTIAAGRVDALKIPAVRRSANRRDF